MKIPGIVALALALAAALTLAPPLSGAAVAESDDVAVARGLVKSFAKTLQGTLKSAIDADGFSHAIGICNVDAKIIAEQASEASGWRIGRTAARVRDPMNRPTEIEAEVLEAFQTRAAAGEALATMEHTRIVENAEGRFLHYMKAIPTGALCLSCHGSDIDPTVSSRIRELYPEDQAIGFREGELRGAFTLYKPLD